MLRRCTRWRKRIPLLDVDAVTPGDAGVSSGVVGRYVSDGDMSVAGGGDIALCGVDTVLSGAVSGGLCADERVSGGSDTDVSGVDTVVSGANIDRVSRGDILVNVDEISLPGGGEAAVSGVDESLCGVNSVITASEIEVCGCDSIVSDEARNSSGVEVVVSSDDAVRVGGWLPVVGDTLMCGAGVARSDRVDCSYSYIECIVLYK